MRKITFALVVFFFCCEFAAGQKSAADLDRLRAQTRVPASTPIQWSNAAALPAERPLKVYISTADDASASYEVERAIQEINKKDVAKYGPIEIVTDISKASVLLIHYEWVEKRHEEVEHTMTLNPGMSSRVSRGGRSSAWTSTEIRGYVVIRKPDGLEILNAYARKVSLAEPRQQLRDAFLKVLKEQAKAQKN